MTRNDLNKQVQDLQKKNNELEHELRSYQTEITKLNHKLEGLIHQMSQQLDMAHSIQRAIVPTEIPNIQGFDFSSKYQSSALRGGDYFDVFELEDRFRFSVLMAHCSGHALSGLLLTVVLRLMSQTQARRGLPSKEFLKLLFLELKSEMVSGDTVSLFYALFDRRELSMDYILVGEIEGFVKSESKVLSLSRSGPSLSHDETPVSGETFTLNPTDRLVLLSPGVVNSRNEHGKEFGIQGTLDAMQSSQKLSTHELRNEIVYRLKHHRGQEQFDQDFTIFVMDVKDKILRIAKR